MLTKEELERRRITYRIAGHYRAQHSKLLEEKETTIPKKIKWAIGILSLIAAGLLWDIVSYYI